MCLLRTFEVVKRRTTQHRVLLPSPSNAPAELSPARKRPKALHAGLTLDEVANTPASKDTQDTHTHTHCFEVRISMANASPIHEQQEIWLRENGINDVSAHSCFIASFHTSTLQADLCNKFGGRTNRRYSEYSISTIGTTAETHATNITCHMMHYCNPAFSALASTELHRLGMPRSTSCLSSDCPTSISQLSADCLHRKQGQGKKSARLL
jgi:hypothetical protein